MKNFVNHFTNIVLVTLGVTFLSGCAHWHGSADTKLVLPSGASQYEMKNNEIFLTPARFPDSKDPEYPADLLGKNIGLVTVCVDVVIQGDGTLSEAKINRADCSDNPDPSDRKEFEGSALNTVKSWMFYGAAICRYPDGMVADEKCEGDGVQVEPVPVRLTYMFNFVQKNGKASVTQRKK
jgi:hypothetical protein